MATESVKISNGGVTDGTSIRSCSCVHCGTDCGSDPIVFEGDAFCCNGCQTVFALLRGSGLGDYYALTEQPGIRPDEAADNHRFAFLDDERIETRLLEFKAENRARITFRVPAIHCVSCVWLLENLNQLDTGVMRAEADLARGLVAVVFNPEQTSLRSLAETLTAIGYEPDLRLKDLNEAPVSRADRGLIRRVAVAGFCFGNVMLLSLPAYLGLEPGSMFATFFGWAAGLLSLPALLYSSSGYWRAAWAAIHRRAVTLDVPIAIGMIALTAHSLWEVASGTGPGYFDSLTGLVFFLLLGRLVQARSYDRLRFDHDYASFFPLSARRRDEDGGTSHAPVDALDIGDRVVLRNGEIMPADGILSQGKAMLDYSFVTGESAPVCAQIGDRIYAGARQTAGEVEILVDKKADASYLTSLWSRLPASGERSQLSSLWRVTGGWFTGVVLAVALSAAAWWLQTSPGLAVQVFAAVLIVACPCALALAAPLGFGFAARALAKRGLFLRDGSCVEQLATIRRIVFDKTGTLTNPTAIRLAGNPLPPEVESLVAAAAAQSAHPVCAMLSANMRTPQQTPCTFHEEQGQGVKATVSGKTVWIGRASWCKAPKDAHGTWVRIDDDLHGPWILENAPRTGATELLNRLKNSWKLSLLTGDHATGTESIRPFFPTNSDDLRCRQQPHDKLKAVNDWETAGDPVLMVGDGLNDAGALRAGTAGIAVSDQKGGFFPACDGLLEGENLPQLDQFLRFAVAAKYLVIGNMALSLLYNGIGLSFAVSGRLSPVIAALLMPASSISVLTISAGGIAYLARKHLKEDAS